MMKHLQGDSIVIFAYFNIVKLLKLLTSYCHLQFKEKTGQLISSRVADQTLNMC